MSTADDARRRQARRAGAASAQPLRIGDWLVHRRLVTRYELLLALKRAYRKRCRLGDAVVELRYLDRERLEAEISAMASFNTLLSAPQHASAC
jgi:hypothetical protein